MSNSDYLTDEEITILAQSLATSRGYIGYSEGELSQVLGWAEEIRAAMATLDLVLQGYAQVDVADEEVRISISQIGREALSPEIQ